MIKLTRLNNHVVAINADCITWADAAPDTTLFLLGGEKIIVRESLDELIALIIEYRRSIRIGDGSLAQYDAPIGDPSRAGPYVRSVAEIPSRPSGGPFSRRGAR
jgi:flagellar protein FlbD